jgi:type IV pilus assembly protein PilW
MIWTCPRSHSPGSSALGFSLIEMMIAITLGLMVLAVIATLFANTSRARSDLEIASQQIDSARHAVQVISEDLQLAGYYGELNPGAFATPAALPNVCASEPAVWLDAVALHVQGYDEGVAVPACVPTSLVANTDIVAVRRVRTCVASTAGCDPVVASEPYLQVAMCGTSASAQRIGIAGDTAFTLTQKDCTTVAGLRRYVVHIYFISSDNGFGVNTPTLKRLEFNGVSFTEVPLADGIERLQIEYGIDTNGDGAPDQYSADPTRFTYAGCTDCTAGNNWARTVTAKIHVLARSIETVAGHRDSKVYQLGSAADGSPITVGPFLDAHRRHVYSAAVRFMNPSGRRDKP